MARSIAVRTVGTRVERARRREVPLWHAESAPAAIDVAEGAGEDSLPL